MKKRVLDFCGGVVLILSVSGILKDAGHPRHGMVFTRCLAAGADLTTARSAARWASILQASIEEALMPNISQFIMGAGLDLPDGLQLDDCMGFASELRAMTEAHEHGWTPFLVGDLALYAGERLSMPYETIAGWFGRKPQTIENWASTARSFERSRRRAVAYSHHAEVVALSRDEQERLLDRAVEEKLTLRALRRLVKAGREDASQTLLGDEQFGSIVVAPWEDSWLGREAARRKADTVPRALRELDMPLNEEGYVFLVSAAERLVPSLALASAWRCAYVGLIPVAREDVRAGEAAVTDRVVVIASRGGANTVVDMMRDAGTLPLDQLLALFAPEPVATMFRRSGPPEWQVIGEHLAAPPERPSTVDWIRPLTGRTKARHAPRRRRHASPHSSNLWVVPEPQPEPR